MKSKFGQRFVLTLISRIALLALNSQNGHDFVIKTDMNVKNLCEH